MIFLSSDMIFFKNKTTIVTNMSFVRFSITTRMLISIITWNILWYLFLNIFQGQLSNFLCIILNSFFTSYWNLFWEIFHQTDQFESFSEWMIYSKTFQKQLIYWEWYQFFLLGYFAKWLNQLMKICCMSIF